MGTWMSYFEMKDGKRETARREVGWRGWREIEEPDDFLPQKRLPSSWWRTDVGCNIDPLPFLLFLFLCHYTSFFSFPHHRNSFLYKYSSSSSSSSFCFTSGSVFPYISASCVSHHIWYELAWWGSLIQAYPIHADAIYMRKCSCVYWKQAGNEVNTEKRVMSGGERERASFQVF